MPQQRSLPAHVLLSAEHAPSPLAGEGWGEGVIKP